MNIKVYTLNILFVSLQCQTDSNSNNLKSNRYGNYIKQNRKGSFNPQSS